MRLRSAVAPFALLAPGLVQYACSPAAPPEVPQPASASSSASAAPPPEPPKPTAARWSFQGGAQKASASARLDGGVTLYVSAAGTRWTTDASGTRADADSLADNGLGDVRRDGDKVWFLGGDGALLTSDTPLGPLKEARSKPSASLVAYRFGKVAVMGATADGTLVRASSPAIPPQSSRLGLRPGERVVALETDQAGNVAVLIWPERALVSTDDGVTFQAATLPGIGAEALWRAGGAIWLRGLGKVAKLAGTAFVEAAPPPTEQVENPKEATRTFVVGDRVVRASWNLMEDKGSYTISPLDGPAGPAIDLPRGLPVFGGEGGQVVVALGGDESKVEVRETRDNGKTWKALGSVDGDFGYGAKVLVAPDGKVVVGPVCVDQTCSLYTLRKGKFVSLKTSLLPEAFDAEADAVVGTDPDDNTIVSVGLASGEVTQWDDRAWGVMAIIVTGKNQARVFLGDGTVEDRTPDGVQQKRYLPFGPQDIALAGKRGLFATGGNRGYETADGGETFLPVPLVGGSVHCGSGGCATDEATRVGWDLPASSRPTFALLSSPPADRATWRSGEVAREPRTIECTAGAKFTATKSDRPSSRLDARGIRLGSWRFDNEKVGVEIWRDGAGPAAFDLLPALPKNTPPPSRRHTMYSDAGPSAARYTFGPKVNGQYAPVDMELGWYDSAANKVGKATLAKLPPFRIGQSQASALTQVVDGGFVLLPHEPKSALTFVPLAGKPVTMPGPPSAPGYGGYTQAARAGKTLALLATTGPHAWLAFTSDDGKSWTTSLHTVGSGWPRLHSFGDRLALVDDERDFLLLLTPGQALPAPTVFGSKAGLRACPKGPHGARAYVPSDPLLVRVEIDGTKEELRYTTETTRVGADGALCTSGLVASSSKLVVVLEPGSAKPGQVMRTGKDGKIEWAPVTCKEPGLEGKK
jgi:hypothetical protein